MADSTRLVVHFLITINKLSLISNILRRFVCDYGKRKANCKKCKQPIEKGDARIAKVTPNFFNDGEGEMKLYHHIACMFEVRLLKL